MLISYNWLKKFIPDLSESPDVVKDKLSRSLAEVEVIRRVEDDYTLEIENKALNHRADLFGMLGLAREVAASLRKEFKLPKPTALDQPTGHFDPTTPIKISIDRPDLCYRYSTGIVKNVRIQPSPSWLQTILRTIGIRPINNIVDITNYLMYKYGQPLHAFDLDQLSVPLQILIRTAQTNEPLVLLDGNQIELASDDLIVSYQTSTHSSQPIALAGIKGGHGVEISAGTQNVFLESANFDMYAIRTTSRRLGLRSDASLRFEKGLDPELTLPVLIEAIQMMTGQTPASDSLADEYPDRHRSKLHQIDLQISQIQETMNVQLSFEQIHDLLTRLELKVAKKSSNQITVTIPTFRKDLGLVEDLLEEIGRLHDYNRIEPTLPKRLIQPPITHPLWKFKSQLRNRLTHLGLTEVYNYSFVDQNRAGSITQVQQNEQRLIKTNQTQELELENPVAPEFSYLRTSLLPSLQANCVENAKRRLEFALFEISTVPHRTSNAELPNEAELLAIIYFHRQNDPEQVLQKTKSLWISLLTRFNIHDQLVDLIPVQIQLPDTQGVAYGFEIEVATLFEKSRPTRFKPIPASPATYQDLSFLIDANQPVGDLIQDLTQQLGEWGQTIELRDVYRNEKLKKNGQKSVTLRLIFQHPQRSLADKEINPIRQSLEQHLIRVYNAQIR